MERDGRKRGREGDSDVEREGMGGREIWREREGGGEGGHIFFFFFFFKNAWIVKIGKW